MDSPERVSITLSLLDTLVDSQYKLAARDKSTDRVNRCQASPGALAVKKSHNFFHFFEKLPLELRNRIYEYCLCRGKVYVKSDRWCDSEFQINPRHCNSAYSDYDLKGKLMPGPAHDFRGKRRPRYTQWEEIKYERSPKYMGLLQGVSKSVQEEASQIFYGPKNHVVLPTGLYPYPETSGHFYVYDDTSPKLPPFKSISYTFDMRDMHPETWTLREEFKETELGGREEGDNFERLGFSPEDIRNAMHDLGHDQLEDLWEKRCEVMRNQLALKFLQIDFEECYCPTGCCRMAINVCSSLGPFRSRFPDQFEVIGVKNKTEAASIRKMIAARNRANKVHPRDIRCVDLNGQSIDYETPAPESKRRSVTLKFVVT